MKSIYNELPQKVINEFINNSKKSIHTCAIAIIGKEREKITDNCIINEQVFVGNDMSYKDLLEIIEKEKGYYDELMVTDTYQWWHKICAEEITNFVYAEIIAYARYFQILRKKQSNMFSFDNIPHDEKHKKIKLVVYSTREKISEISLSYLKRLAQMGAGLKPYPLTINTVNIQHSPIINVYEHSNTTINN